MIDVGAYSLTIGRTESFPEWLQPVYGRRDAAYVDTGFLRALLVPDDQYHELAALHWSSSKLFAYTSPLVVAEVARQFSKSQEARDRVLQRAQEISRLCIADKEIAICAPPQDVVERALSVWVEHQLIVDRLDLCDALSFVILDTLKHRRVLGFDHHFNTIGASLEPS